MIYYDITDDMFTDIIDALHTKANLSRNMFDESNYKHLMDLSRKLTAQRIVIESVNNVRRNKIKPAVADNKPVVTVQSAMNDEPTFQRNAFKLH